jgi:DNA-binding transcriptional ArsR family regulator
MLKHSRLSAGEIVKRFDMTGATISHHLTILKEAGLVRSVREGKNIYYELNLSVMEELMVWIQDLKENSHE